MPFHYAPPMQVAMQPVALLGPDLGRIVWPLLQLGFLGCVAWRIFPHPLAVIFSLLMLLGAAGTAGYTVRLQTKEDVEDAIIMAELEEKD